ncbi:ATPase, T2SS/T4P/T4SS family [Massilia aquatica]|uniref:ATP-binding cassette domain-containing protein n=1 Tax=Massilia aquatica TaxID=2609000 RepID=A0ABX0LY55_9BURK|nr:ATPase, T2SS/T4P/T4SS family [Massilia aquatica]NHZ39809.1 ATP-binding cassette domain-containing protein [Massilia aquatica]
MITIESRQPDGQLADYLISKTAVIGAEAASPIPLPAAAGKGALRLTVDAEGGASVIDLASLAGVFVNGERIVRYGPLRVDDAIMVGGQQLRVKAVGLARPAEPVKPSMRDPVTPAAAAPAPLQPIAQPHSGARSDAARAHHLALSRNAEVLHAELIQTLDLRRQDVTRMGDTELRSVADKLIRELMAKLTLPAVTDPDELARFVLDEAVGLGVLESLLADGSVTEIMVNGAHDIFVERDGQTRRCDIAFSSEKALMGVIERIVSPIGRRVDESSPLCDGRLKDGSRVNIAIRPIALKGPSVSIRKFAKRRLEVADLVSFDSVDAAMVAFLRTCVEQKKNIVISGGTGSGKTTLLNIISNLIPPYERIVTIEDAAELKLYHDNLVTLEARPANVEGRGQITIRELVKNALRMRPDRIVVGECRGGEALDMLQAMNTGHDGSLTTAHANSPRDMLSRLEVMVMMGGMDLPVMAIREQVAAAVQIIVQQTRFACGTRKVTSITEITGMERGVIQMQEIYRFQRLGFYDNGKVRGQFVPCGNVPTFYEELRGFGIAIDLTTFGVDGAAAAGQTGHG